MSQCKISLKKPMLSELVRNDTAYIMATITGLIINLTTRQKSEGVIYVNFTILK